MSRSQVLLTIYLHRQETRYLHGQETRCLHGQETRYLHGQETRCIDGQETGYLHGQKTRYLHGHEPSVQSTGKENKLSNLLLSKIVFTCIAGFDIYQCYSCYFSNMTVWIFFYIKEIPTSTYWTFCHNEMNSGVFSKNWIDIDIEDACTEGRNRCDQKWAKIRQTRRTTKQCRTGTFNCMRLTDLLWNWSWHL